MRCAVFLLTVATLMAVGVASASSTKRHTIPTSGLSLATPSSWRAIDSKTALASKGVQSLLKENPQLAALIQRVTGTNSAVKFLAIDPRVSDRFATNVNVVVTPLPPAVTFALLADAIPHELKNVPGLASKITTSIVKLPIGRAIKASYRLSIVNGVKTQTVQTLQYIFLRHSLDIVVTFSTTPSQSARRAATFTAIAASIHAP